MAFNFEYNTSDIPPDVTITAKEGDSLTINYRSGEAAPVEARDAFDAALDEHLFGTYRIKGNDVQIDKSFALGRIVERFHQSLLKQGSLDFKQAVKEFEPDLEKFFRYLRGDAAAKKVLWVHNNAR